MPGRDPWRVSRRTGAADGALPALAVVAVARRRVLDSLAGPRARRCRARPRGSRADSAGQQIERGRAGAARDLARRRADRLVRRRARRANAAVHASARSVRRRPRSPARKGRSAPFFSPDGRWVGFYANGMLQRVSIDGGARAARSAKRRRSGARRGAATTSSCSPTRQRRAACGACRPAAARRSGDDGRCDERRDPARVSRATAERRRALRRHHRSRVAPRGARAREQADHAARTAGQRRAPARATSQTGHLAVRAGRRPRRGAVRCRARARRRRRFRSSSAPKSIRRATPRSRFPRRERSCTCRARRRCRRASLVHRRSCRPGDAAVRTARRLHASAVVAAMESGSPWRSNPRTAPTSGSTTSCAAAGCA